MSRVLINYCPIEELMSLPGVGVKVADKILEMRGLGVRRLESCTLPQINPTANQMLRFCPF
jgi:predicted DNA-binding helix-hairpin-helix protein